MANARTEIKVRLKKIEIPLGILWFSNQDEIGYKAKAKKTPQKKEWDKNKCPLFSHQRAQNKY